MILTSSNPHDDFSVKVLGGRIKLWTMDLPCHCCVRIEAGMDHGVAVCLGPVLRIVVDVRRRLALMGRSICLQEGARLATM
jgi:hypothetical protein